MSHFATAFLLFTLALTSAGCGGPAAVTDINKLTPLTEDQTKAIRQVDDQLESEEHANPVKPQRGKAKANR